MNSFSCSQRVKVKYIPIFYWDGEFNYHHIVRGRERVKFIVK